MLARVCARTVCYINHLQRGNLSAIDLLNLFVNIKFSRFINLPQVPSVFVDSNSSRVEFELNARVLYINEIIYVTCTNKRGGIAARQIGGDFSFVANDTRLCAQIR